MLGQDFVPHTPAGSGESDELARMRRLRDEGRLAEFDYPYRLARRPWESAASIERLRAIIARCEPRAERALRGFAGVLADLLRIPVHAHKRRPADPHWCNGWFPGLDAVSIYGFLAERNPARYYEVGSGNSTKFARRAIQDHDLRTEIISIDPHPRAEIDAICDRVLRCTLEDVEPQHFNELTAEDVLFVDNSHRALAGSDVTVFFTEILPVLPPGILYGIHDICLPQEYPREWAHRFYNEQYMLATYLFGGADGDEVVLPCSYLTSYTDQLRRLDALWKSPRHAGIDPSGCAFWMERGRGVTPV